MLAPRGFPGTVRVLVLRTGPLLYYLPHMLILCESCQTSCNPDQVHYPEVPSKLNRGADMVWLLSIVTRQLIYKGEEGPRTCRQRQSSVEIRHRLVVASPANDQGQVSVRMKGNALNRTSLL